MSAEVAVLWLLVFIIGAVVGVSAILALSAIRGDHDDRAGHQKPDDPLDDQWPERDHPVSGIPGH